MRCPLSNNGQFSNPKTVNIDNETSKLDLIFRLIYGTYVVNFQNWNFYF